MAPPSRLTPTPVWSNADAVVLAHERTHRGDCTDRVIPGISDVEEGLPCGPDWRGLRQQREDLVSPNFDSPQGQLARMIFVEARRSHARVRIDARKSTPSKQPIESRPQEITRRKNVSFAIGG